MSTDAAARSARPGSARRSPPLLDDVDDFRSAQEIHALLARRGERVGLTTVYRTLQALADAGEVDVCAPRAASIYRRCSEAHHHHLVCRSLRPHRRGRGPGGRDVADRSPREHGYSDVSHTLEIFGTCRPARADPARSAVRRAPRCVGARRPPG